MTRVWALCLLVACLPPAPVETSAPPTRSQQRSGSSSAVQKRVVINQTRPSGYMTTSTWADGTIAITYHVVENGRGPHVDATLHLAPDWTLQSFRATGHHEMGNPIDETFTRTADKATWKSEAETGDRAVSAPAFFVPIADIPIEPPLVPA